MSTLKNGRSTHVVIPKVKMFRMMNEGDEGKGSAQRPEDPQLYHEVNT